MSERDTRVENLVDPSLDWDCSPPVDVEDQPHSSMWMKEFIDLHVGHEISSTPCAEREKNLRALRARFENDA